MSDAEVEWGELPPDKRSTSGSAGIWYKRLAPFRDRPGQWGNLGPLHPSTVTHIKTGKLAGLTAGEYEATGRNMRTVDGKIRVDVWVRYVGDPS
jgi:hypothetical protein